MKKYALKVCKYKVKGEIKMENVISLKDYKKKEISNNLNFSLADMIFDKDKREAVYRYYDKKYTPTKEEDKIFDEMRNNREDE